MGALISRLRQSNDSDYEKILSDLDSNIRKVEHRLSAIRLREKRFLSLWLLYSVLAWIGYLGLFVFYLHSQYEDQPQQWAASFAPTILGLPVIYVGRALITVWYKRAKTNEESQLSMLRADQRLKVEELKKKSGYYSTKTLLERYDPTSQQARPNGQRPGGPDGRPPGQQNGQQNGQQRPPQPGNMMDPGLRQRTGLGVNSQGIQGQGRPMGMTSGAQLGHGPQMGPRAPQGPYDPQNPSHGHGQPRPHAAGSPYGSPSAERHWYDKIVDVIVGDEGPDTRYALICGQCFAHNGLALPQEIEDVQYTCPKCNFFNPSRRKLRMATNPVRGSINPNTTLLQAQGQPLPASRDPSPSPSHRSTFSGASPEMADGPVASPRPSHDASRISEKEHSENDDIEFVNNWNSDDAHSGVEDHDELDTDDAQGYIVRSGVQSAEPRAKEDAAEVKGPRTRAAGKRKPKRN